VASFFLEQWKFIGYIGKTMTVSLNPAASYTGRPIASSVPAAVPHNAQAAALSSEAVDLSEESAVVATLGGGSGAGSGAVYSAAGLLGTLEQAGTSEEAIAVPEAGSNTDTSQTAPQAMDQGILSAYSAAGSASGVYTVGGNNGLSDQASTNWAEILKSNPAYASDVIGSSFAAGIIGTLHISA